MALHMGDLLGMDGMVGTQSGWAGGVAQPQESVTNLSAHVDGGTAHGTQGTNAASDTEILHWCVGIVIVAGLLLWLLGGVMFKSVRL